MNRSERKKMEKRLGVNKQTLTREQKFEKIRQNIISGNMKQNEMKEVIRRQVNQKKDQDESNKIASMATSLMISEGLDYIDALEKAKEIVTKQTV